MGITNAPFAAPPGDWSQSGYTKQGGILYGPKKQQAASANAFTNPSSDHSYRNASKS
jgi:hypothetical protein